MDSIKSNLSEFHQIILDVYQGINIPAKESQFENTIHRLSTYTRFFDNEALMKNVFLEEIKRYCFATNKNKIYKKIIENFH